LPFPGAERLYAVRLGNDKPEGFVAWPYPKYAALAREQDVFDATAAYAPATVTIDPGGRPLRAEAEVVTSSYFPLFGVRAAIGRVFTGNEERVPARDAVVVLGDALWRRSFGADPNILGRPVTIKDRAYAIVGVLPPGFRGQSGTSELWLPVMMADHFMYKGAASASFGWWMRPVARLAPSVTEAAAAARMPALSDRVGRIEPSRMAMAMRSGRELFQLVPYRQTKIDPAVSRSFIVLLGAVGFVLLIACANTANLLLGRALVRRSEFAVRRALGASRGDIVRQILAESLAMSLVAGTAALAVARWTLAWLTTAKPLNVTGFWSQYARTFDFFDVTLDWRMAAVNFAVALGVGLLFALLPARQAAGTELTDTLNRRRSGRARSVLVVVQLAVSVAVLASAGLLVRSFANAAALDLGFVPDGALSMSVSMQQRRPASFYRELHDRLRALPGIEAVALADGAPVGGGVNSGPIEIESRTAHDDAIQAGINVVTPGFFDTLGIRRVEGRGFAEDDGETAPRAAIVSRAFAAAAWPGQSAIGKRIRHGFRVAHGDADAWTTVIGVVDDAVYGAIEDPRAPMLYLTAWQPLGTPAAVSLAPETIIVRTRNTAAALTEIRDEVRRLAPSSPVYDAATMAERAARATSRYRYGSAMMSALALLALLLAGVGTYAVAGFTAATRTREFGIRMALGAQRADVLGLVLGSGLALAAAGIALGLASALAASRMLSGMLFGVTAHDPVTFVSIALVVGSIATIASYVPARRATRIDPVAALRAE
jgi:predicted permease